MDPEAYSDMDFSPVESKALSEFVTGEWFRSTWNKVGYKLFGDKFSPQLKGLTWFPLDSLFTGVDLYKLISVFLYSDGSNVLKTGETLDFLANEKVVKDHVCTHQLLILKKLDHW